MGKLRSRAKNLDRIKNKWAKPVTARRNFEQIRVCLDADNSPGKLSEMTADDLDLKSIFNYIDRTNSKPGKQYLYKKLHFPETAIENLLELDRRAEAIAADGPQRELIELELSKLNHHNAYQVANLFLKSHQPVFAPVLAFYIRIVPYLILAAIISLVIMPNPVSLIVLGVLFGYNIIFHFASKKKIAAYADSLPQLLIMHKVAVWLVKNAKTGDTEKIKRNLVNLVGLKRSLSIVNFESELVIDSGSPGYAVFQLLKTLLLFDPFTYVNSVKHIDRYRDDIEMVFNFVAEIDMLIAVQSVRQGLPFYNKPEFISRQNSKMEITDLFHPLIERCVPNSLYTRADRGALITGSNMSGKTTFIKAIAVNTLLAQTIFTSCAKAYKAPFLKIQTSIKVSDSIEEQQSFFQAQASAILNIVDTSASTEEVKSLVIIDEIFRGTNTIERIAAAKSVLSYITANDNFVFVSTHDIELAELLDEDFAIYSFEDSKSGGRLVFDYKLKQGLLKSKNGIAILASMGYPESVIEDAHIVSERMMLKYIE
ncbi:MAG TPA: hypothetical protein VIM77_04020 [Mucilaginibacter sp.]